MEATKVQNLVVLDPPQKNLNVEIIADVLAKLRKTDSCINQKSFEQKLTSTTKLIESPHANKNWKEKRKYKYHKKTSEIESFEQDCIYKQMGMGIKNLYKSRK